MEKQSRATTDPATKARAYIRELVEWEALNGYSTTDLVAEWCNHGDVSIDEAGDVWISEGKSGRGHWLRGEYLQEFVEWHRARVVE